MSKLRASLLITFFSTNGSTAVNFLVGLVLARLLSPSDIGIFSITSVLISIAHIFRDFGVSNYLLREKELTPQKVSSAFGVLIASSWLIALTLYFLSAPAASYFNEPGVARVMPVLALGFIFIPFGSITHALLTREYRAKEQAFVNIFGTTAYAASSIILALLDFGYMSLAWANLINILVTAAAYAPYRPTYAPWIPTFKGWRSIAHFGAGSILSNSVAAINGAFSDIFLGKMSRAHDVGIYSRANGTAFIFMQVAGPTVNYAALPHLAQTFHSQGHITPQLSKANAFLSVLAWPVLGITAIYAHDVIMLLYGEKWLECVPLIAYTCVIVGIGISINFLGTALTAIGRPYLAVIPSMVTLATRLAILLATYDGSLTSFALGMIYGSLLSLPFSLWLQSRFLHFPVTHYLRSQTSSLVVTAMTCLAAWGIDMLLHRDLLPVIRLAIMFFPCLAIWYVSARQLDHPAISELHAMLPDRMRARLKA